MGEKKTWKRHLDIDVLPILVVTKSSPAKIVSYEGTGFLIAPNLFVTCWHCLRKELPENQTYAVNREQKVELFPLRNIQQDSNGTDLATANVAIVPEAELALAEKDVFEGTDVHSFGYPLINFEYVEEFDETQPALDYRLLRGYITRNFWRDDAVFGRGSAYELDMPTPEGLSGSPLFLAGTREVLGVIFGQNEVALIDSFARVDPETREKEPEIQKIYHFGLAQTTETLRKLRTTATRDLPLSEYLKEDLTKRKAEYHFYVRGKIILQKRPFEAECGCGQKVILIAPYEELHCTWCASSFKFSGVMDGVSTVVRDGEYHSVVGGNGGFVIADQGQGLMIMDEDEVRAQQEELNWRVSQIIGKEFTKPEDASRTYFFPVKQGIIGSDLEIPFRCECGSDNRWLPPHSASELQCLSCSSRFVAMELEGNGEFVVVDGERVRVFGTENR